MSEEQTLDRVGEGAGPSRETIARFIGKQDGAEEVVGALNELLDGRPYDPENPFAYAPLDRLARRILALAATPTERAPLDDPELDGTDAAHPAWWRGHYNGADGVVRVCADLLDGKPHVGRFADASMERLAARLAALASPVALQGTPEREPVAYMNELRDERGELVDRTLSADAVMAQKRADADPGGGWRWTVIPLAPLPALTPTDATGERTHQSAPQT